MPDYPDDFQKAVRDLIDNWEGTKYTETKGDAGRGTKFGISKRSYPKVDIKALTRDQAVQIYYHDFWLPTAEIENPQMRAKVFNMGVLMGINEALLLAKGSNNISEYRFLCEQYYKKVVAKHHEDEQFLKDWLRRAAA